MSTIHKATKNIPQTLCFDTETIDIINPNPYPEGTTDEGIPIEVPDKPENMFLKETSDEVPSTNETEPRTVLFEIALPRKSETTQKRSPTGEESNQAELLRWNYRLGHISMHRIQRMASTGILPSRIARCKVPLCQACVYGMMTRRAWRSKGEDATIGRSARVPGQHISIIGQIKGTPTRARYRVATIFVDAVSSLSYVHLQ
jgi:GAG-pre-integrase domain